MSISSLEFPAATSNRALDREMCVSASPTSVFAEALHRTTPAELLVINRAGQRSIGVAELGMDWLEQFHAAPELMFQSVKSWLKQTTDRRAALVEMEFGNHRVNWFLKETQTISWRVRIVAHLAACRSANAWQKGHALCCANISTPRPVAYSSRTNHGVYQEYLLTEALPESMPLSAWLLQHPLTMDPEIRVQRQLVTRELATQLRRLHQHRFDHRDLKASNVLVTNSPLVPQVWLIDLDGVWQWPVMPKTRIVQNLARLWVGVALTRHVTLNDAVRFLKIYLGPEFSKNWKSLWKSISRRATPKFAAIRCKSLPETSAKSMTSDLLDGEVSR